MLVNFDNFIIKPGKSGFNTMLQIFLINNLHLLGKVLLIESNIANFFDKVK